MSFLSSLRSGAQSEQSAQSPHQASEFLSDLRKGMPLSAVLPDGKQLLTGKLSAYSATSLTLERLPGALSFQTCPPGQTAYIRGCTQKMIPFSLRGTVEVSSRVTFRLKDLKPEPFAEHRETFRLPVQSPASLFYPSDEHLQNPEQCSIIDISTGGACIESEFLHAEGEVLRLKIKIDDYAPMQFLGEIIRVQEVTHGVFQYGFLYAQLTEDETNALTKTLYNIQVGNRRLWTRSEEGHW